MRSKSFVSAVAACLLLGSSSAWASFAYSTSLAATGLTGSGGVIVNTPGTGFTVTTTDGTTITVSDTSRGSFAVPGTDGVDLFDITVNTTNAGTPVTVSIPYSLTVTLTNTPSPGTAGSGPVTFTGHLDLTSVSTGTGLITDTITSATSSLATVGGLDFTVQTGSFGTPTINGNGGNLGGVISVPEPTTVAGLGVAAAGLFGRRRRA